MVCVYVCRGGGEEGGREVEKAIMAKMLTIIKYLGEGYNYYIIIPIIIIPVCFYKFEIFQNKTLKKFVEHLILWGTKV